MLSLCQNFGSDYVCDLGPLASGASLTVPFGVGVVVGDAITQGFYPYDPDYSNNTTDPSSGSGGGNGSGGGGGGSGDGGSGGCKSIPADTVLVMTLAAGALVLFRRRRSRRA